MEVHVDIVFGKHPCHLLGLDVVDNVGTHRENEEKFLKKIRLNSREGVIGEFMEPGSEEQLRSDFLASLQRKEGCKIKGHFNIMMVPGNFHIGFHSKMDILRDIAARGGGMEIDFSHYINHLYFGKSRQHKMASKLVRDFGLKSLNVLDNFSSNKLAPQKGPFSFKYKLVVLPTDLIYESGAREEIFQYRTFWNIAYFEQYDNYMVTFEYDLSPVTVTETRVAREFTKFLTHLCGIVGGLIAFATFVHNLLQKSVLKVMHKHALGKYD